MFTDDIVIHSECRVQVEENLERWRSALETRDQHRSDVCVKEQEDGNLCR